MFEISYVMGRKIEENIWLDEIMNDIRVTEVYVTMWVRSKRPKKTKRVKDVKVKDEDCLPRKMGGKDVEMIKKIVRQKLEIKENDDCFIHLFL